MLSNTKYSTLSAAATVATSCGMNTLITNIIPAKRREKKDLTLDVLRDPGANKKSNSMIFFLA